MKNLSKESNIKKHAIKIIIPIVIVIIISAIWIIKNTGQQQIISNNSDFALHVTEELDLVKLKSYGLPIIIDFGADDCAPCREMAPVLEKLNEELQGKAIIKFIDVWKYQNLAQGYPLSVIPTQIFYDKEGKPYTPSNPKSTGMELHYSKGSNLHIFTSHKGGMTEDMILATLKEMGAEL